MNYQANATYKKLILGGKSLQQLGYLGVFLALLLEAIGIPFPSETILITSGVEMSRGVFHLAPLWFAAALGNLIGSNVAYVIGRFLGRRVILKYGKYVKITEQRLASVEVRFQKFQALFLVVGKFIAFVRIAVPYLAGINEVNFVTFSVYNTLAAIVWSFILLYLGKSIELVWVHYSHTLLVHWYISVPAVLVVAGLAWWAHKKTKS